MSIAQRWADIDARVTAACARAGRDRSDVSVVAVSKMHPASAIAEAYVAGARQFGENYVQEWLRKAEHDRLVPLRELRWRFIGRLQRNKVRHLMGRVDCIETVGSERLAREISKRAVERGGGFTQSVLLQVNVARQEGKGGFLPEDLDRTISELCALPGLAIDGLMHIPPPRMSAEETRPDHRNLAVVAERLRGATGQSLIELSMGMSADFEVAIEEGATRVRVGTALFGPRSG